MEIVDAEMKEDFRKADAMLAKSCAEDAVSDDGKATATT